MDEATRLNIEQSCARCSISYGVAVDGKDYDSFADQFSEDAILELGPTKVQGRSEIRDFITKRPDDAVSKHVFTNILIDVESDNSASGVTYLVLYKGQSPNGNPITSIPNPALVGHYEDHFVRTGDGWKIASRKLQMAFVDPTQF